MRKFLTVVCSILALALTAGCAPAQLPSASAGFNVDLTASAPVAPANASWSGCAGVIGSAANAPGCTYGVFKCTGSATACPSSNANAWAEITNPAARPTAPAFTDPNATGTLANYAMVTYQILIGQTKTSNSTPSNIASVQVPGIPTPPTGVAAGAVQTSWVVKPALPFVDNQKPVAQMAFMTPMQLTIRIVPRK